MGGVEHGERNLTLKSWNELRAASIPARSSCSNNNTALMNADPTEGPAGSVENYSFEVA